MMLINLFDSLETTVSIYKASVMLLIGEGVHSLVPKFTRPQKLKDFTELLNTCNNKFK